MLATRGGTAQNQASNALRVVNRELLSDHPAHRHAKNMGTRDIERIKQANYIAREQRDRIGDVGLVREPSPAVIVGDDSVGFSHFPNKFRVPGRGWRA